jgi:biopolymer transport protein ExbB
LIVVAATLLLILSPFAAIPAQDAEPASVSPSSPEEHGLLRILFSGGWVGMIIMLVLFALSLTAAYLVFEQMMLLRRAALVPDGLSSEVRKLLDHGRTGDAERMCREQPSLLAYLMLNGMSEIHHGWSAVEKALEDTSTQQAARLFRKIEYLAVIGNLAPMVGLLGTVTGMLLAFREVAASQGSAGAGDLAGGIYQALVTTVVGLIIAIPSLGAFAILRNRVDQLVAEAAFAAQQALTPIKRRLPPVPQRSSVSGQAS